MFHFVMKINGKIKFSQLIQDLKRDVYILVIIKYYIDNLREFAPRIID